MTRIVLMSMRRHQAAFSMSSRRIVTQMCQGCCNADNSGAEYLIERKEKEGVNTGSGTADKKQMAHSSRGYKVE